MKKLMIKTALIIASQLAFPAAQAKNYDYQVYCRGYRIENGTLVFTEYPRLKLESNDAKLSYSLDLSGLFMHHYNGLAIFKPKDSESAKFEYYELFDRFLSSRDDHFIAGLTLESSGRAYINYIGGKSYNLICSYQNESAHEEL